MVFCQFYSGLFRVSVIGTVRVTIYFFLQSLCNLRVLGCFYSSIWQAGSWCFYSYFVRGFIFVDSFFIFSSVITSCHPFALVGSFYPFFCHAEFYILVFIKSWPGVCF